jgi:hypothetical protein
VNYAILPGTEQEKLLVWWRAAIADIGCNCSPYSSRECLSCRGRYAAQDMLEHLEGMKKPES